MSEKSPHLNIHVQIKVLTHLNIYVHEETSLTYQINI